MRLALAGLAALLAVALALGPVLRPRPVPPRTPLGLFTSLPILWGEAADLKDLLQQDAPPHWARAVVERRHRIVPLDTLVRLEGLRALLVAQPRALLPQENVALDRWVRGGGRVLLFADPMLTWDSAFPVRDRRRPQDVALLSPILARWGLDLRFDERQPAGLREIAGSALPVNLAGAFALRPGGVARCRITDAGLVAQCRIGAGRAVIVADSALLEPGENAGAGAAALDSLMDRAFGG